MNIITPILALLVAWPLVAIAAEECLPIEEFFEEAEF
jgi:hypothetical protein